MSGELDGWPYSYLDVVRYGDLDANRHLNNVVFLQYFESARIKYIVSLLPEHDPTAPGGWGLIFAEAHLNYRSPGYYDEGVRTHVRIGEVQRSSFRVEFLMRSEADGRTLAEGWGALVGFDYATNRAMPLPADVRTALEAART